MSNTDIPILRDGVQRFLGVPVARTRKDLVADVIYAVHAAAFAAYVAVYLIA